MKRGSPCSGDDPVSVVGESPVVHHDEEKTAWPS
jgi:hypothetical protein